LRDRGCNWKQLRRRRKRTWAKRRKRSVCMRARLLQGVQVTQDFEEMVEERREEMMAADHLLQRLQPKLERVPFKWGLVESQSLRQHLKKPLIEGKIAWPLQWEFNQGVRELDKLSYGGHKSWAQMAIVDLKWILARMEKWT
jgi:hypothetical protein